MEVPTLINDKKFDPIELSHVYKFNESLKATNQTLLTALKDALEGLVIMYGSIAFYSQAESNLSEYITRAKEAIERAEK